jgi:hypothetical protein
MLICRGDAFGMDGLREILGVMARQSERRMLLGRWGGDGAPAFLITPDDAAVARSPDFEPIVVALPDGALLVPKEERHGDRPGDGGPCAAENA